MDHLVRINQPIFTQVVFFVGLGNQLYSTRRQKGWHVTLLMDNKKKPWQSCQGYCIDKLY